MSVATLQAIEDRSNFYRLDWRLLSPFVLTLVHLGKDILTQATFGAREAVSVGRRAEDVSLIEPLQPVPLPLGFVLSGFNTVSDSAHDIKPGLRLKSDRSPVSYLYLFAVLYFWYILIGRAHNLVCFDPFIISKIECKDKRDNFIIQIFERSRKNPPLTPPTTQTPLLSDPKHVAVTQ